MEVSAKLHPGLKLGPVEYILYVTRCTTNGATINEAISAEDYERIYPVLMCCSFPMNTFENFHRGLFTMEDQIQYETEGELACLRSKVRSVTNDRVDLLPISRTLYELFYLKQYLYARIETDFATETVDDYFNRQQNMLLIRPFFFDHNSKLTRITLDEFCAQARTFVLEDPYLCLLHYELNTRLVEYLKSHVKTTNWSSVTYTDLEHLIENLCHECEVLQKGTDSALARQFDTWPLTSPALGARLDQLYNHLSDVEFEQQEDALEEVFLNEFSTDIKRVKRLIKTMLQNKDYRAEQLLELIASINNKVIENELYGLLFYQYCAELSSFDLEALDNKTLNKMLTTINIVDKVDTCVDRFRKRGYINRELINRCIQLEMEPQQEDVCFLYRATNSIDEEGNTIKNALEQAVPHSLSFGPSIFAGAIHDKTATAYNYLIQQKYAQGYLIRLPQKEFFGGTASSLFFMPPLPAIVQLASIGELFHPRSKVCIEEAQL
eukprot:TRINITY_DN5998_c0_g1_i1.p1 TRINITY_DN5998_c0_g1~~TRINITY_DN5998_c0_g1_i1.p1  ORF type:complete len:494 (+),score=76.06 TRINITY_DN5998_c0_g1_i1:113-1594(+)